jgi:ATP-dependent DNA ligase
VLDGEVAIYDQELRSRFEWLREPDRDAVATPPLFMVVDLLFHDRRDLDRPPAAPSPLPAGGRRRRK